MLIIVGSLRRVGTAIFARLRPRVVGGISNMLLFDQFIRACYLAHPSRMVSADIVIQHARVGIFPEWGRCHPLATVFQHRSFLELSRRHAQDTID